MTLRNTLPRCRCGGRLLPCAFEEHGGKIMLLAECAECGERKAFKVKYTRDV